LGKHVSAHAAAPHTGQGGYTSMAVQWCGAMESSWHKVDISRASKDGTCEFLRKFHGLQILNMVYIWETAWQGMIHLA
jgi:hypothetical protein